MGMIKNMALAMLCWKYKSERWGGGGLNELEKELEGAGE